MNHIFYPNALFFFLLTGATQYYQDIYKLFTLFAGYEDDNVQGFLNWHVQRSKFGKKIVAFGRKSGKS